MFKCMFNVDCKPYRENPRNPVSDHPAISFIYSGVDKKKKKSDFQFQILSVGI